MEQVIIRMGAPTGSVEYVEDGATPAVLAVPMTVPMAVTAVILVIVVVTLALIFVAPVIVVSRRFPSNFVADRLKQFFEFAAVQPDATALRTDVDFDPLAVCLSHPDIAVRAGEKRHHVIPRSVAHDLGNCSVTARCGRATFVFLSNM